MTNRVQVSLERTEREVQSAVQTAVYFAEPVRMGSNSPELVQYLMSNLWIHGVMAITNIYFSLLTYHKHNFLTPIWPFQLTNWKRQPGSRPKLPDVTRYTYPIPFVSGRHIPHHENSEAEHHPSYTVYYGAHITGPISVIETIGEPRYYTISTGCSVTCRGQKNGPF